VKLTFDKTKKIKNKSQRKNKTFGKIKTTGAYNIFCQLTLLLFNVNLSKGTWRLTNMHHKF